LSMRPVDHGENQPLREGTRGAGLVPIPEEESHDERGMGVGPGGIEIHVDRQRAGPPDGERGKERPAFFDILARETEGKEQAEKSVERGGEGHGDAVRSGKAVGGNGGTEGAREKDADMSDEEKRRPENRWADCEMIVQMAGGSAEDGFGLVYFRRGAGRENFRWRIDSPW